MWNYPARAIEAALILSPYAVISIGSFFNIPTLISNIISKPVIFPSLLGWLSKNAEFSPVIKKNSSSAPESHAEAAFFVDNGPGRLTKTFPEMRAQSGQYQMIRLTAGNVHAIGHMQGDHDRNVRFVRQ